MVSSSEYARQLHTSWRRTATPDVVNDYDLIALVGAAYAARTRDGLAAVVIPLTDVDRFSIGRRAAGCELFSIKNATFRFRERTWESAAAALTCHDEEMLDTFQVLAGDVIARVGETPTWGKVVAVVQEWQSLLAAKSRPSVEGELGLWGELWFMAAAQRTLPILAAWRGPDRDATDFFLGGESAEIKTSRYRRRHHMSLTQVPAPVGLNPAWILSLWVKEDPIRGLTVADLVADLEARCEDTVELLRRLLRAGFSSQSRTGYVTKYTLLAEPEWYAAANVPTVRDADPGVSEVRFRVDLDEHTKIDSESADRLWQHFLGQGYAGSPV